MALRSRLAANSPTWYMRQTTRLGCFIPEFTSQRPVVTLHTTTFQHRGVHDARYLEQLPLIGAPTVGSHHGGRSTSKIAQRSPTKDSYTTRRFREFELDGRVFVITGGARGLGLTLAEALVEAGGNVYCLDRLPKPAREFFEAQDRVHEYGGTLDYREVDVQEPMQLDDVIGTIAIEHQRMDGLIAAAGIQYISDALEYPPTRISEMMDINFGGVYLSAVSCARQMIKYNTAGSMVLIASMSGLIANKGLRSSVYNASKAAVIQLTRNLAMEWGKVCNGRAIRVNALCPGNILTPMLEKNFDDEPYLRPLMENENMIGRLSRPHEYRGAALFMLSDASSFMTGSQLVIDGGYTAW